MKFSFKPTASFTSLVLAGLLTTFGASAMAQGAPTAPPAGSPTAGMQAEHNGRHMGGHPDRHDPAKMQAWIAKRQAEVKAQLKITPAQEGAWTTYTTAMQPSARGARPTPEQRAEFDKLTTPQRIDKMRAMRTERMAQMNAAMDKRGDATKVFYAALTPDQQKVFGTEHKKHGHHGDRGERKGPRG